MMLPGTINDAHASLSELLEKLVITKRDGLIRGPRRGFGPAGVRCSQVLAMFNVILRRLWPPGCDRQHRITCGLARRRCLRVIVASEAFGNPNCRPQRTKLRR